MYLPWWSALSSTASKFFTQMALVLLTNFKIILALVSTNLLTSKLLSVFHYFFFVCSFQGIKALHFALLTEKKKRTHWSPSSAEDLVHVQTRDRRWKTFKRSPIDKYSSVTNGSNNVCLIRSHHAFTIGVPDFIVSSCKRFQIICWCK